MQQNNDRLNQNQLPIDSNSALQIFSIFFRLGLSSFGGPIAHLGFFHREFVTQRRWFSDTDYADLVALCQFLPGPGSSQVGMAIGLARGGIRGALAAWLGFTLPSALLMIGFGLSIVASDDLLSPAILYALKIVTLAVVAQALISMTKSFCRGYKEVLLLVLCAGILILSQTTWLQLGIIGFGALVGRLLLNSTSKAKPSALGPPAKTTMAKTAIGLFSLLALGLPLLNALYPVQSILVFDAMYRTGALVFGGGHVVLPLMQSSFVETGWISANDFLAGYGVAQAMPGPLFTFAGYIGAVFGGWQGGLLAIIAVFLPSLLLVLGTIPFWERLRAQPAIRASLAGVNVAVVGILIAAFYHPIATSTISGWPDVLLCALAFGLLQWARVPSWLVVLIAVTSAWAISLSAITIN